MTDPGFKRALFSVYDKSGVVEFARALVDEFGIEVISTGGTASRLKEGGVPVTLVEEVTGFPEMMDGRVKTLHPKIHAAILADRDNPDHLEQLGAQKIEPIDLVVVNLYPFEETISNPNCTFAGAIEMIDIGGPCLLRAAAKNHKHVLCVTDPTRYDEVLTKLREGGIGDDDRVRAAAQAFAQTCRYDAAIAEWMSSEPPADSSGTTSLHLSLRGQTRYGENPHTAGAVFALGKFTEQGVVGADLAGADQEMSFNNYVDADAALELCKELTRELGRGESERVRSVCTFIKHTNACGVGVADTSLQAYERAYLGDPNAAMGGVLACNFRITGDFAEAVMATYDRWGKSAGAGGFFVEVWVAPEFDEVAVEAIRTAKKWGKRVRLLAVGAMGAEPDAAAMQYKTITGGMLGQGRDLVGLDEGQWKSATTRAATDGEMDDLRLAWLVCKHTKSNAITICKNGMLIGNGAGQMSRVMSCRIATWLAQENSHSEQLLGSVAASDAFFPFDDGPIALMAAGVTALIQPGGSKRDRDTIAACDERGAALILTGTRHFKH